MQDRIWEFREKIITSLVELDAFEESDLDALWIWAKEAIQNPDAEKDPKVLARMFVDTQR